MTHAEGGCSSSVFWFTSPCQHGLWGTSLLVSVLFGRVLVFVLVPVSPLVVVVMVPVFIFALLVVLPMVLLGRLLLFPARHIYRSQTPTLPAIVRQQSFSDSSSPAFRVQHFASSTSHPAILVHKLSSSNGLPRQSPNQQLSPPSVVDAITSPTFPSSPVPSSPIPSSHFLLFIFLVLTPLSQSSNSGGTVLVEICGCNRLGTRRSGRKRSRSGSGSGWSAPGSSSAGPSPSHGLMRQDHGCVGAHPSTSPTSSFGVIRTVHFDIPTMQDDSGGAGAPVELATNLCPTGSTIARISKLYTRREKEMVRMYTWLCTTISAVGFGSVSGWTP